MYNDTPPTSSYAGSDWELLNEVFQEVTYILFFLCCHYDYWIRAGVYAETGETDFQPRSGEHLVAF